MLAGLTLPGRKAMTGDAGCCDPSRSSLLWIVPQQRPAQSTRSAATLTFRHVVGNIKAMLVNACKSAKNSPAMNTLQCVFQELSTGFSRDLVLMPASVLAIPVEKPG